MIELDVIEESDSEYASPVVPVKKSDGTIRFCIDYRELNKVTKFDPFPMPTVDDMINKIQSSQFVTTIDLTKCFW